MKVFGYAERLAVRLYPYRLPLGTLLLVAALALLALGWRRGWGPLLWRRRVAVLMVAAPLLAVVLPVGYYTLSPLWTRTTLYEESPLLAEAAVRQPPTAPSASAPPTRLAVTVTTPQTATVTWAPSTPTPHATPSPLPTTPLPIPKAPPTPTAIVEPTPTPDPATAPFEPRLLASSTLSGADDFHFAEGATLLIESEPGQYVVRLENVSVRNGPDLFVYLSPSADGLGDGSINLGGLKATDGSFNYAIPDGVDVSQFAGVVIWCRQFAVLFATAPF